MRILVTGAAGFIGYHLAKRFCERGDDVLGIDNLNDYYDVSLKQARLRQLEPFKNFRFMKIDVADRAAMEKLFSSEHFDRVLHMAAQAGVRYSIENPHAYIQANIVGFMNILEGCRHQWCHNSSCVVRRASCERDAIRNTQYARHLVYASSSSVYGLNTKMPFSVNDNTDHQISLYGATKKANELMAHTYSYLYGIPTTGLRFFTVYGPWGRPDMAYFKFTRSILEGKPIDVYNNGNVKRDFTYIDDIVEGVVRITDKIPILCREGSVEVDRDLPHLTSPCKGEGSGCRLYNIGNNNPVELSDFITAIEDVVGKKATRNFLPMQAGDVPETYADVDNLIEDVGFSPSTPIKEGINKFVDWYKTFYM